MFAGWRWLKPWYREGAWRGSWLDRQRGCAWQKPVGCLHAIGIGHCLPLQATGIAEIVYWMSLLGHQHRIVPDRGRTLNTGHIEHRRIVIIAGPDAHHVIGGITNRPVIA